MSIAIRLLSIYLSLVGLAVAVHFVAVAWYHPGGDESYPIWEILNYFMAVALLIGIVSAFVHKQQYDRGDRADLPGFTTVNAIFYGTLAVAILFFWNWSHLLRETGDADWLVWNFLDVGIPLALAAAGRQLWRSA